MVNKTTQPVLPSVKPLRMMVLSSCSKTSGSATGRSFGKDGCAKRDLTRALERKEEVLMYVER